MLRMIRPLGTLFFLWTFASISLFGQEVFLADPAHPGITRQNAPAPSAPLVRAPAALTLPFFDDFSSDSLRPTADKWMVFSIDPKVPGVSNEKGTAVPSKGVCTFDGTTFFGKKYSTDLETGINDTLTSLDIDLSTRGIADSIYLSFFLERGGGGETPEPSDSFVVFFDTSGNFEYIPVLTINGLFGGENTFNFYQIALDDPLFFHSAFRFKFISYGSLNGEFDQFHLDYVYLDLGRSRNDDVFNDISPAEVLASPFAPYTALPLEQYQQGGYSSDSRVLVSNAGNPSAIPTGTTFISEPTGNNTLVGTTSQNPTAPILPPFAKDTMVSSPFSDQGNNFLTYGALRLNVHVTSGNDAVVDNDSLHKDYPVDTLMGYDDGVADYGYGTTSVKSICQEYTLSRPDTLTALWINFTPTLHYNPNNNQSTCLENKGFKIAVWDTLSPDSFLTQASHTVSYDSSLNEFVRYPLIRPLLMKGTFWVGLQQSDGMPIGIGWDTDGPSGYSYFEDVSGNFLPSSSAGCMMIRPEFGVNSDFVASRTARTDAQLYQVGLSPQPWQEGPLNVQLTGPEPLRQLEVRLINLQGQELWSHARGLTSGDFSLALPTGLVPGMYLLHFEGTTRSGKPFQARKRAVIHATR